MLAPSPSLPSVAELRARIASTAVSTRPGLPFGIVDLDRHLAVAVWRPMASTK